MQTQPVALTVGGSDSGGGAGIQADIKTFAALDVFGTSVVTCITAQNPTTVTAVYTVDDALVRLQILACLLEFPVKAAKTGMLYSASIVEAVANTFKDQGFKDLVVDPVMISSSGVRLLRDDGLEMLEKRLLPIARLITPNLGEAEALASRSISTVSEMRDTAKYLADRYQTSILIKGGHLPSDTRAVDVLFDGEKIHEFDGPHINGLKTHGTGCCYASAITAHLASGKNLLASVEAAKSFITEAIRHSVSVGKHTAINPFWENDGAAAKSRVKRNGNGNAARPPSEVRTVHVSRAAA